MSGISILDRLNNEHFFGNLRYEPICVWRTPTGEMGIYRSDDTPISSENILTIVSVDQDYWVWMRPAQILLQAIHDMEIIALFADAERIYPPPPRD